MEKFTSMYGLLHIAQWSKCGKITEQCLLLIVQKPRIIWRRSQAPWKKEFFFCIMSRLPSSFTIKKSDQPQGKCPFLPNCHGSTETYTSIFLGHFFFQSTLSTSFHEFLCHFKILVQIPFLYCYFFNK